MKTAIFIILLGADISFDQYVIISTGNFYATWKMDRKKFKEILRFY
jgi:hypothetical protein